MSGCLFSGFFDELLLFLLFISVLSVVTSLIRFWYEFNLKRLVATTSIFHLNLILVLLSVANGPGVTNLCFLLAVIHSLSSALLFLSISFLSSRYHTYDFNLISGLCVAAPRFYFSLMFVFFICWIFPISSVFLLEI